MVVPKQYRAYLPHIPIYQYNCRVCMKPYHSVKAARWHKADSHGPRMKCGQCKFMCTESRLAEMKNHYNLRHGTGSPTSKSRRQSALTEQPCTERIPAETPAVESYTLAPNQDRFLAALGAFDFVPEPYVEISKPTPSMQSM